MLRVWVSSFYNYQKPPQTFSLVTGIESMEYYYCKLVLAYGEKVKIKLNGDLTTQLYDYIMNSNNKFGYRKLTDKIIRIIKGDDLNSWYLQQVNRRLYTYTPVGYYQKNNIQGMITF